jgi:glycosyltransferase involved in cell wall biosynthesis
MNTYPVVSVVTTLYNCAAYVKESIQSILSQTFTDFEFIILNDGSTDDTWDIVEQFKDDRIIFINSSQNKKIPTRRNEIINRARGEYITIHDGDDLSLPHRLAEHVEFLKKNRDIFCCGAHAEKIDQSGKQFGMMTYPPETNMEVVRSLCKGINPVIDPTSVFRTADFRDLGGYSLEKAIYTVPDYDLWCRAVISGKKFYNLQLASIRYRVNPEGMTQKHKVEMIKAHRIVMARHLSAIRTKKG